MFFFWRKYAGYSEKFQDLNIQPMIKHDSNCGIDKPLKTHLEIDKLVKIHLGIDEPLKKRFGINKPLEVCYGTIKTIVKCLLKLRIELLSLFLI